MDGETPWGGQTTNPGPASQPPTTTNTGIPGTYEGEGGAPDQFSKGYQPGKFFFGE